VKAFKLFQHRIEYNAAVTPQFVPKPKKSVLYERFGDLPDRTPFFIFIMPHTHPIGFAVPNPASECLPAFTAYDPAAERVTLAAFWPPMPVSLLFTERRSLLEIIP
jgi:hypothetical protein